MVLHFLYQEVHLFCPKSSLVEERTFCHLSWSLLLQTLICLVVEAGKVGAGPVYHKIGVADPKKKQPHI